MMDYGRSSHPIRPRDHEWNALLPGNACPVQKPIQALEEASELSRMGPCLRRPTRPGSTLYHRDRESPQPPSICPGRVLDPRRARADQCPLNSCSPRRRSKLLRAASMRSLTDSSLLPIAICGSISRALETVASLSLVSSREIKPFITSSRSRKRQSALTRVVAFNAPASRMPAIHRAASEACSDRKDRREG